MKVNGKVNALPKLQEIFSKAQDGIMTVDNFTKAVNEVAKNATGEERDLFLSIGNQAFRFNLNGNKRIGVEEVKRFSTECGNKDGKITIEDFTLGPTLQFMVDKLDTPKSIEELEKLAKEYDRGTGAHTLWEALVDCMKSQAKLIKEGKVISKEDCSSMIDTDYDGKLSKEELIDLATQLDRVSMADPKYYAVEISNGDIRGRKIFGRNDSKIIPPPPVVIKK